ncbi:XkdF-like putative serine protease domain-containing protein [Marinococcus luteus]|uniref:XkdF-like putative serine protease domain-containing protein n=1 Tax=Marinococcus luteus TaxID=1122204 RepID=UPI002ACC80A5|nr:XkdF-like putative serine protease domain-containing protein [Marinococcus luteus]MDZ5782103.1 XkdF-like putative serine protease domain-containing protein [Marinococcus luteus]
MTQAAKQSTGRSESMSMSMNELTGPVITKNDEERVVEAPVLVPDEPDSDEDVVSADKIRQLAHKFVEDYGNIDLQHSLNNVGNLVESYISKTDMDYDMGDSTVTVPKGSWMMAVRVTDDDSWNAVKSGALGGFSIMGVPKMTLKSKHDNSLKNAAEHNALKRTTLDDLGDDYVVNAVSLVDEPAVPKAKWVSIKSKTKSTRESATADTVQKAVSGSLEHRQRIVEDEMDNIFFTMDQIPFIHATFQNLLVMRVHNDYGMKFMQVEYEMDEEGKVTFTSQPEEVTIEEQIVPVENGARMSAQLSQQGNSADPSTKASQVINDGNAVANAAEHELNSNQKSFLQKASELLGISPAGKAGRTISDANYDNLVEVKKRVDTLVDQAEKERAEKSNQHGGEDMNKEEIKEIVKSTMRDELAPMLQEANQQEPEGSKKGADDENNSGAAENGTAGSHKETGENGGDDSESSEKSKGTGEGGENGEGGESSETVAKSEYDKAVEELEQLKKHRPLSQRLAGQDGDEPAQKADTDTGRDMLGYKKKA